MTTSGSYRNRYLVMHDMVQAFGTGAPYERNGEVVIEDNGGQPVPIGLTQGAMIANQAAMSSNILSVIYDATGLKLYVSYETGTGPSWLPASKSPYAELDLVEMIKPL